MCGSTLCHIAGAVSKNSSVSLVLSAVDSSPVDLHQFLLFDPTLCLLWIIGHWHYVIYSGHCDVGDTEVVWPLSCLLFLFSNISVN